MLNHPDIHLPWSQWSEDQKLHLVIPYVNPWRWRTRRELLNDCYRHFKNSPNVIPYRVEVAFGARPFEVTGDDPNDLQLRTTDELWLKENCINLAVARKFPADWLYGGYADGDFHFTRHDWALEAIHLLQHYDFVQLFSTYADITGETATSWQGHRPYRLNSTFAWNYMHGKEFLASQMGKRASDPGYFKMALSKEFPYGFWPGAPGGAWAWRRPAFDTVGGLLDTCVLGSGDYHMAAALAMLPDTHAEMALQLPGYMRAIQEWRDRAAQLHANIGCVDNFAVHNWHGNKTSRGYGSRVGILGDFRFDPFRDIQRDWQGLWKWDGRKPKMRDAARRLFLGRNEDESALRDSKGPLV